MNYTKIYNISIVNRQVVAMDIISIISLTVYI